MNFGVSPRVAAEPGGTCEGRTLPDHNITLLAIEDDRLIRRLLRTALSRRGYTVIEAGSGKDAIELLRGQSPDLIILDLGLPDVSGLDLLHRIREESSAPVVILSNTASVATKIEALEMGASDYVTKPFNTDELAARLRVALRHRRQQQGLAADAVFRNGDLVVDLAHRLVTIGATAIRLPPTEFALLRVLTIHAGKVLTHDQILQEIGSEPGKLDYLRTYVRQLRKRMEADPHNPRYVVTVPGVGYQLLTAEQTSVTQRGQG
jgi:two-component system, OmpR family, KDP operon response regulator KdpE